MENDIKYRHELKYQCSAGQIAIVKNRLENLLCFDKHAKDGTYCIRSMYFDNYANKCYYENENGTDPREKFRIRIYNASDKRISLECKRKESGKTHKTSCVLTKEQYNAIMNDVNSLSLEEQPPLLRKFICLIKTQLYKPVVIVEYDRIPYVYRDGNVRVTIDTNIRSSDSFDEFFEKNIRMRQIMPAGQHLIEVKYDEFLPDFIKESLQFNDLIRTTFSKYYLCRKFSMGGLL